MALKRRQWFGHGGRPGWNWDGQVESDVNEAATVGDSSTSSAPTTSSVTTTTSTNPNTVPSPISATSVRASPSSSSATSHRDNSNANTASVLVEKTTTVVPTTNLTASTSLLKSTSTSVTLATSTELHSTETTTTILPTTPTTAATSESKANTAAIIGGVLGALAALFLIGLLVCFRRKKQRRLKRSQHPVAWRPESTTDSAAARLVTPLSGSSQHGIGAWGGMSPKEMYMRYQNAMDTYSRNYLLADELSPSTPQEKADPIYSPGSPSNIEASVPLGAQALVPTTVYIGATSEFSPVSCDHGDAGARRLQQMRSDPNFVHALRQAHVMSSSNSDFEASDSSVQEMTYLVQEIENLRSRMDEIVRRQQQTTGNVPLPLPAPSVNFDRQTEPPAYSEAGAR